VGRNLLIEWDETALNRTSPEVESAMTSRVSLSAEGPSDERGDKSPRAGGSVLAQHQPAVGRGLCFVGAGPERQI